MGPLESDTLDNHLLTDESDGPGFGSMFAFDEIQDVSPESTGHVVEYPLGHLSTAIDSLAYHSNSHSDYETGGWGALDD